MTFSIMSPLPARAAGGEGEARSFLITARNGRADALYYYNEETGDYYMAQLREASLVLPALLEDLVPNGGQFAFENSSLADTLAPYMMLLPQPPPLPCLHRGQSPGRLGHGGPGGPCWRRWISIPGPPRSMRQWTAR